MGRTGKDTNAKKLTLLQRMKEHRHILFGKHSPELDNAKKVDAWNDLLALAKSLMLVTADKDYIHLRDKVWGPWKSRTLKKKDNAKQTGTGGGKECKLNEVDHCILDIIGRGSAVVEGLSIGETGEETVLVEEETITESQLATAVPDSPAPVEFPIQVRKRKSSIDEKETAILRKYKAQTELLQQQAYNMKLLNYKLEKELGLQQSNFTAGLVQNL